MSRVTSEHSGGGTKTDSMFANLLNRGSYLFMEGVKNLVPKKHNLPLTKVSICFICFENISSCLLILSALFVMLCYPFPF